MGTGRQKDGRRSAPRGPLWQRLFAQPEGKILLAGIVLMLIYATVVGLTRIWSHATFDSMWTMTSWHIAAGRAAGITWGLRPNHELPLWVVIVANMGIETILVLLFYPLFVFSYRRLLVIKPLEAAINRARGAAEAHHKTVVKYGIPGLFLFSFFPFYLTGPMVGSIVGFIIGFRPLVNLSVVLAGTYVAIVCWAFFLHRVTERLEMYGTYIPFALLGLILLVALGLHLRSAFSREPDRPSKPKETAP
jgi:uncharacterized membrane protein